MSVLSPVQSDLVRFRSAVWTAVDKTCAVAGDLTEEEAYRAVATYVRNALGKDTPFYKIAKRNKRKLGLVREGVCQKYYPELRSEALRLIAQLHGASGTRPLEGVVSKKLFCKDMVERLCSPTQPRGRLMQTLPSVCAEVYKQAVASGGEGVVEIHGSSQSGSWSGSKGAGIAFCDKGEGLVVAAAQALLANLQE
eukprot:391890-Prymnesium_polylepis.1